jgi:hypothetical protein
MRGLFLLILSIYPRCLSIGTFKLLRFSLKPDASQDVSPLHDLPLQKWQVQAKPELSNDNLVINELIREYLVFNG